MKEGKTSKKEEEKKKRSYIVITYKDIAVNMSVLVLGGDQSKYVCVFEPGGDGSKCLCACTRWRWQ